MTKFIFSTSKVVQLNNFPELDAMIFKIFQDAISYEKEVVKLLSCDNLTKNQKTLLVQPMNGLTLKEFIEK